MADYISREEAIEELWKAADCANCNAASTYICDFCDIDNAARLINGIPAADVEPVRHGRWEKRVERGRIFRAKERMVCSCCGSYNGTLMIRFNYCPNCGAKMDLEDKENDN